jgi:hypothetical protein
MLHEGCRHVAGRLDSAAPKPQGVSAVSQERSGMERLPAGRLARHAYLDTLANLRGLIRVGGPWLLLAWALVLLARIGPEWLGGAANIAITLGVAAIAVTWHRHILLAEPLTARIAPLDGRVARYFALTVLIALGMGVPPLMALMLLGAGGPPEAAPSMPVLLLVPMLLLACLYVALRLQLVFPAIAIADASMGVGRSWALTQGNGWRLLLGFLLITLPVAGAIIAITLFLGWAAAATGSVVLLALADLSAILNAWLQAPLIASFLSYAYLWFQQQAQVPGAS